MCYIFNIIKRLKNIRNSFFYSVFPNLLIVLGQQEEEKNSEKDSQVYCGWCGSQRDDIKDHHRQWHQKWGDEIPPVSHQLFNCSQTLCMFVSCLHHICIHLWNFSSACFMLWQKFSSKSFCLLSFSFSFLLSYCVLVNAHRLLVGSSVQSSFTAGWYKRGVGLFLNHIATKSFLCSVY